MDVSWDVRGQYRSKDAGYIFGVVPGLAFLCKQSCGESIVNLMMSSPVLDEMDYSTVKVAYVLDPCPNQVCRIAVCAETFDAAELGYDLGAVQQQLGQESCTMVDQEADQNRLMNLPEDDSEGKPILNFRGTPIRDFMQFLGSLNLDTTTRSPSSYGKIFGKDRKGKGAATLAAKRDTFAEVLVWYYAGLNGQRETARQRLWAMEQEKLGVIVEGLFKPTAEDERAAQEQTIASIAAALEQVEETVNAEYLRDPALAGMCERQPLTPDLQDLRETLDKLAKDERNADRKAVMDIAIASFSAAFSALCVAADLGVPGTGSALNALKVGLFQTMSFGKHVMVPSVLQALSDGVNVIDTAEGSVLGGAALTYGLTVAEAARIMGEKASTDKVVQESQAVEETFREKAARAIKAAKKAMKDILKASSNEAAWTAAGYLPFVGPFTGLGRGLATLADVTMKAYKHKMDYFKAKDPVLRSLFRMRDCSLDSVRVLGAVRLATNQSISWEARVAMLMSAVDAGQAAAAINEDLISRLFKQVWHLQSKESHERGIMNRLITGHSGYGTVPVNASVGDSYLPAAVLRPTVWQEKLGNAIRKAYPKMRRAALRLPPKGI